MQVKISYSSKNEREVRNVMEIFDLIKSQNPREKRVKTVDCENGHRIKYITAKFVFDEKSEI